MPDDLQRDRRIGSAILRVHENQENVITKAAVAAKLGSLLRAGKAMDFAARLRSFGNRLTRATVNEFAALSGIDQVELRLVVLPALARANVLAYEFRADELISIEEYVGVTAPILGQTVAVFEELTPSDLERCLVDSVDVAAWAPLAEADHLDYLAAQGYCESLCVEALRFTRVTQLNYSVASDSLQQKVIYNPYVWGTEALSIADFLKSLPSDERNSLLGVCETVLSKPGIPAQSISGTAPALLKAARKVGLIQSAKVISTRGMGDSQTFLFSPALETQIALSGGTESLHERKLFVAHIMYGHRMASSVTGRISDPIVLVSALLRTGQVGPAGSIGTDYKLLEAAGIVQVTTTRAGRPVLEMVKEDVVRDGLEQLRILYAGGYDAPIGGAGPQHTNPAGSFRTPEQDRSGLDVQGADLELLNATVLTLREEARRVARGEGGF